jgi:energy-converting hydrogenase Eha subunit H
MAAILAIVGVFAFIFYFDTIVYYLDGYSILLFAFFFVAVVLIQKWQQRQKIDYMIKRKKALKRIKAINKRINKISKL